MCYVFILIILFKCLISAGILLKSYCTRCKKMHITLRSFMANCMAVVLANPLSYSVIFQRCEWKVQRRFTTTERHRPNRRKNGATEVKRYVFSRFLTPIHICASWNYFVLLFSLFNRCEGHLIFSKQCVSRWIVGRSYLLRWCRSVLKLCCASLNACKLSRKVIQKNQMSVKTILQSMIAYDIAWMKTLFCALLNPMQFAGYFYKHT